MTERISFGYYSVNIDNPYDAKPIVDLRALADALPHGSGLDDDYTMAISKNGNVHIVTSFNEMDGDGFYCGWTPVNVRLMRATKDKKHELPKKGFYQLVHAKGDMEMTIRVSDKHGLLEYLWDVFSDALGDFVTRESYATYGPHGRPAKFVNGEWREE